MMDPGADATLQLALRAFPEGARVAVLADAAAEEALRAARRFASVSAHPAPCDAVLARRPSLARPLIPTLMELHDALPPGGHAVVSDVVWQTAPTPDLAAALAPAQGREKVRPIEGYEMQLEHAGFRIVERVDVDRAAWAASAEPRLRAALEADARKAARHCAWSLARD